MQVQGTPAAPESSLSAVQGRGQSLLQHSVTFGHRNTYIRSAFLVCSTQAQAILG